MEKLDIYMVCCWIVFGVQLWRDWCRRATPVSWDHGHRKKNSFSHFNSARALQTASMRHFALGQSWVYKCPKKCLGLKLTYARFVRSQFAVMNEAVWVLLGRTRMRNSSVTPEIRYPGLCCLIRNLYCKVSYLSSAWGQEGNWSQRMYSSPPPHE